ncbi:MAG TPA: hypothetical protein DD391_05080 [Clostridiales bacterium]|nr:hypothetical protein [Clostridiales bacterium]
MMKKKVHSFFSLFLAVCLLTCTFSAFAADNVLGGNITWKVDGSVLYLEGSGDMTLTYEYLTDIPWYEERNNIDTIVIGDGITSLAEGAFTAFRKLKTVEFPSSMTTIGSSAFLSCEGLESIVLSDRITRVEGGAFVGCEALKTITVPGSVYYISSDAFYNCFDLTIVGIPGSYAETFAKEHDIPFDGSLPAPEEIMVSVNRSLLTFDQPPVIVNDRTLVPLRAIFEALGAVVDWEPTTRTVTARRDDINISLVVDTNIIKKNGADIEIDVPAQIVGDRTMVPVRAISESLGASVDWDPATRTVLIDD